MQDKEEAEQLRLAREIEEEKAMYSVILFLFTLIYFNKMVFKVFAL